jgi:1,2-dihydroxy-3-keto-5-methylthiopentene dioxygenase
MTTITVYEESGRGAPIEATDDPDRIAQRLSGIGVGFRRLDADRALPPDADEAFVLNAYAETIEQLKQSGGYHSVDVVRLLPDAPDRDELRARFLAEHTHDDDEMRFFVEGGGSFFPRGERDDLIEVPAGAKHWFDTGVPPFFTAIRLPTRPDGWVGAFTGDTIASRFVAQPA